SLPDALPIFPSSRPAHSPQAPTGLPSPLWGGAGGGGTPGFPESGIPPTLSLPHKGGGDAVASALASTPHRASLARSARPGKLACPLLQPFQWGGNQSRRSGLLSVLGQQAKCRFDLNLYTAGVGQDLVVPEAKHTVALGVQPLCSSPIGGSMLRLVVL